MSDWDTVPITLRKRAPKAAAMKSEQVKYFPRISKIHIIFFIIINLWGRLFYFQAVNAARRQGVAVDTQSKCKSYIKQPLKTSKRSAYSKTMQHHLKVEFLRFTSLNT